MPDQPTWIDRVPEILKRLESAGGPPFLDRPAVEVLFRVRRRQAITLLHRFGGYLVGKTFLAPREGVAAFLRDSQRWTAAAAERGRFERVRSVLGEARQDVDQRRISIPVRKAFEFSGLPAGIQFEPGKLTVAFSTPAELLEKLFALAQAIGNDYDSFEKSWRAANPAGGPQ